MKLTKIIEKLYNNQLETTKQVDAIQAHANNLKGLNLARLKLIDKLDKIEAEPSGNIEQLKEVVQELESDHTCTHPHWEETPTKNIIIKTCSTCGAQKYE